MNYLQDLSFLPTLPPVLPDNNNFQVASKGRSSLNGPFTSIEKYKTQKKTCERIIREISRAMSSYDSRTKAPIQLKTILKEMQSISSNLKNLKMKIRMII